MSDRFTEGIRRFSCSLHLAEQRHEKHGKRILGEQLNEAPKKEGREKRIVCQCYWQHEGWEPGQESSPGYPQYDNAQRTKEKPLNSPFNKGGATGSELLSAKKFNV